MENERRIKIPSRISKHIGKWRLYYIYTAVFLVLYYFTAWHYAGKYGKTLLWSVDGVEAEFIPFAYVGQWIRQILFNIFHLERPFIPMWDMSIGYGSDIITTFQGTLFDPFNWLSALFPTRHAEAAFRLVIFLKRFFSGITFIWLAKYKKADDVSALAGAVSYAFCVSILICFKQVYLTDQFYIFPLLILGVEKLWESKKGLSFYSLMLALAIINSYYYTFMMGIFVAGFLVLKLIFEKQKTIKWFGGLAARFAIGTALGGITGVGLLLGGIVQLLGMDRISYSHPIGLIYDGWIHKGMMVNLVGGVIDTGTDALVGVSIITFICLIMLFFEKGYLLEKISLVVLTVCLFIPFVGHVFNGFSYATDRWIFGYSLLVSWIVCITFNRLCKIRIREGIAVAAVLLIHFVICKVYVKDLPVWYIPTLLFGLLSVVLLCLISKALGKGIGRKTLQDAYLPGLLLLSVSAVISSYQYLSPRCCNFIDATVDRHSLYDNVVMGDGKTAVYDDEICENARYDEFNIGRVRNSSMLIGAKGFDFYMHFYNNNIDRYDKDLGVVQDPDNYCYYNLYSRPILQFLNGVNAIISPADNPYITPGYEDLYKEHVVNEGITYDVFTGEYPRTMAYTYDKAVAYGVYDDMNSYDRETLMSKACVVDGEVANCSLEDIPIAAGRIDTSITAMEGTSISDESLTAGAETCDIRFDVEAVDEPGYLYVYLGGLNWIPDNGTPVFGAEAGACKGEERLDKYYQIQFVQTVNSHMYGAKEDLMLCLGHVDPADGIDNVWVNLQVPGLYTYGQMGVYYRKDSEILDISDDFDGRYLNMSMGNNRFSVDASNISDRYVYLAIPYSKGWKASLDGKPVNIHRANVAFMAIDTDELADKGSGIIEFTYSSPLFGAGLLITLVGFAVILVLQIKKHR